MECLLIRGDRDARGLVGQELDSQETETEFMIIRIIAAGRQVEIDDATNFKAFSVRIEGPFGDPVLQAELLGRVALGSDREHAWISEKALREWPSLASEAWWQEGLTNMIAAVQKFGWIDNTNHSIRAHIERLP
jgi:predicted transcriptional regulator